MAKFTGFTYAERDYLRRQPLGCLATVDASGPPQANPVGYFLPPQARARRGQRRCGVAQPP